MSSSIFWKLHFLDPPSHIQHHKQIDIMFRITNSTLMDRKYPNALAYIKIEAVIRVKQKLWAVKIWAKMIWKQPRSFGGFHRTLQRVRLANRGRLLLRTPGPVPFGTCIFLMLRPFFPELVMSTDLLSFEHPSVLLFCLSCLRTLKAENSMHRIWQCLWFAQAQCTYIKQYCSDSSLFWIKNIQSLQCKKKKSWVL